MENFSKKTFLVQQKGHKESIRTFLSSVYKNDKAPINLDELLHVSEMSIKINNALKQ